MSVTIRIGNLLDSKCQTLVNTVNTVGVMGKGIAAQFKDRYPAMYRDYRRRCEIIDAGDPEKVQLGRPYIYKPDPQQLSLEDDRFKPAIINFPTKEHWRRPSDWSAILEGLDYLAAHLDEWDVASMAVPPLGCGHGGLEWRTVGPALYERLAKLGIPIELYAPHGTPPEELDEAFLSRSSDVVAGRPTHLDIGDAGLAHLLGELAEESEVEAITHSDLRAMAYWLGRAGFPRDTTFSWGPSGMVDESLAASTARLVRNAVIHKRKRGNVTDFTPGVSLADMRRLFSQELDRHDDAIQAAREAFLATRKSSRISPEVDFLVVLQKQTTSEAARRILEATPRRSYDRTKSEVDQIVEDLSLTRIGVGLS